MWRKHTFEAAFRRGIQVIQKKLPDFFLWNLKAQAHYGWRLSTCIKDENYSIQEFQAEQYCLSASLKQNVLDMSKRSYCFYSIYVSGFLYITSAYDSLWKSKNVIVGSAVILCIFSIYRGTAWANLWLMISAIHLSIKKASSVAEMQWCKSQITKNWGLIWLFILVLCYLSHTTAPVTIKKV